MQLYLFSFLFFHYMYRGGKPPEDGCMKPKHVVEEEKIK
jgi:hypothetical protein